MARSPQRVIDRASDADGGCLRTSASGARHKSNCRSGLVVLLVCLAFTGCRASVSVPAAETGGAASINLHSTSFPGNYFPAAFTCRGANLSPALNWTAPPAATKSLTLVLYDLNTSSGGFVHWVLFDLPPSTTSLPESVPARPELSNGARQGRNDFGVVGYGGPCPPGHWPHHYRFALFALDTKLDLPAGATRADVDAAMKGHVLARGALAEAFIR